MTISAALDTSSGASFAVACDGVLRFNGRLAVSGRDSDERLLPWLVETLASLEMELSAVEEWTVGTGPGSFAGMRVGISLVKGICAASGARCRGLPTSLALGVAGAADLAIGELVGVLHDARRRQIIYTEYRLAAEGLEEVHAAAVLEPEEVEARARECRTLITLHAEQLRPLLTAEAAAKLLDVERVDAGHFLQSVNAPWSADPVVLAESCEPLYVRPAVFVKPQTVRVV
jgi:tRNA threonylcarbamoyladenosine biosynthesis protein TsaB